MNVLKKHADRTCPELEDLESLLGCVLEGVEGTFLHFISEGILLMSVFKAIKSSFDSRSLTHLINNGSSPWSSMSLLEYTKVCYLLR